MPGLVKIGKSTQQDVQNRINQLYGTSIPFPFDIAYACKVNNVDDVESALHLAFAPQRVNAKREFFAIDPGQIVVILKLLDIGEIPKEDLIAEVPSDQSSDIQAGKEYTKRRPKMDLFQMGMRKGDLLTSLVKEKETVSIISNRKIQYKGEETSLSKATSALLGLDYLITPGRYWQYNGRNLSDIYEDTYPYPETDS